MTADFSSAVFLYFNRKLRPHYIAKTISFLFLPKIRRSEKERSYNMPYDGKYNGNGTGLEYGSGRC